MGIELSATAMAAHPFLVTVMFASILSAAIYFLQSAASALLLRPRRVERHFRRQGVGGPRRGLFSGNAGELRALFARAHSSALPLGHDGVAERAVPHYAKWLPAHGRVFLYWFGTGARLAVADLEMVRAALSDPAIGKIALDPLSRQLFGDGLVALDGEQWALHRRLVAPAFNMGRIKCWIPTIAKSVSRMLDNWEGQHEKISEFEIDVHKEFHDLSADVIACVAFGSSFEQGKHIFQLQDEQVVLVSLQLRSVYIPGFRFIPTKKNRMRRKLNNEIRDSLRKIIQMNGDDCENSQNLLGLLLSANKSEDHEIGIEEIIDECKTFYFAGKETTANFMTWAVLLLAMHHDWQVRAREEVLSVCGSDGPPTSDNLNNLKIINMVLKETLRLYPLVALMGRTAKRNVKLGSLDIPAGTLMYIPMITLHRDKDVWGPDSNEFNPTRFADNKGYHPGSYLPFGQGPTMCVGQNLAMVEAKVAVASILQRYELSVSPSYVHAPMFLLTLQPQYGTQILFKKL